jgi:three-Cys-motif partner protein
MRDVRLDEVGHWTEIKLQIIREYSAAYAAILRRQSVIRHHAFIDGFAGAGTHIAKSTGEEIEGSPLIALQSPFSHYHFIDMDGRKADRLRQLAGDRTDVSVYRGDCNDVLLNNVFPKCAYSDYRRGLCLLDPYGLNPNWEVVETAGKMKSIEIFLNFSIMDANMNPLRGQPDEAQIARMNRFWGDGSWREAATVSTPGLFGDMDEKASNETIVQAYASRLREVAGFDYVVDPLPMRNSKNAVVYYLMFASPNQTGAKIARSIFKKFMAGGMSGGYRIKHRVD